MKTFFRLYMDGVIAAMRKEDFVKKINLQDWRSCPDKCVGRGTAYSSLNIGTRISKRKLIP